jgi:hypothetical protein
MGDNLSCCCQPLVVLVLVLVSVALCTPLSVAFVHTCRSAYNCCSILGFEAGDSVCTSFSGASV